jgi:hypothetical protein
MNEIISELKSADNEGTAAPYWLILNPRQNMNCDIHDLAYQITGPYFSRTDAENYFNAHRHNFGKNAHVYCLSGCYSYKYSEFYKRVIDGK